MTKTISMILILSAIILIICAVHEDIWWLSIIGGGLFGAGYSMAWHHLDKS